MKDGPGMIEIVDSNGNSVKLETSGITINAAAKVTVSASQVAVSAGMVTVDAGMSKLSGVVQADTVITNTIIAATYTPGAGNIW
jgi:phage baseplate assembly protein gpV